MFHTEVLSKGSQAGSAARARFATHAFCPRLWFFRTASKKLRAIKALSQPTRWLRRHDAAPVAVPPSLPVPRGASLSTREAFGRILGDIAAADGAFAEHIVTASPDVTVSTNLGLWVNRGIFDHAERADTFREEHVVSAQRWAMSPHGQHIELGIAESNLCLLLADRRHVVPCAAEQLRDAAAQILVKLEPHAAVTGTKRTRAV
jgi:hypothetical protein